MTIDDICRTYNLPRLTVLTKIANARLIAYGGKYLTMDIERAFAPPAPAERPVSDEDAREWALEAQRRLGW